MAEALSTEWRITDLKHPPKGTTLLLLIAYVTFKWIYRLTFHPLVKVPGPKLAAMTHLYEGYYDVVKKGRYIFEIEKMHQKYGPIVRIGPQEVHILDPEYYSTLYAQTNHKVDKSEYFYSMFGNSAATFDTIDTKAHQLRRGALDPFFSTAAVAKLEPKIQAVANKLVDRIAESVENDEAVPLSYAYRSMTADLISEYTSGAQLDLLNRQDWGQSFHSGWRSFWEMLGLFRQIPLLQSAPQWLVQRVKPGYSEVFRTQATIDTQLKKANKIDLKTYRERSLSSRIVMYELGKNKDLSKEEKKFRRLATDANSILAVGSEMTGSVLTLMTYLILSHTEIYERLKKELGEAIPAGDLMPSWHVLEKLPLFSGIVNESLRLSVGALSRLPRVNPTEDVQYKEWTIPAGMAIGMSNLFIALSPTIFPSPKEFKPDRWGKPDSGERRELEKQLHPFGKGSRMCVAQNLAYAELYITIATLVTRLPNLRIDGTKEKDLEFVHDYFGGMIGNGKEGLRVKG